MDISKTRASLTGDIEEIDADVILKQEREVATQKGTTVYNSCYRHLKAIFWYRWFLFTF